MLNTTPNPALHFNLFFTRALFFVFLLSSFNGLSTSYYVNDGVTTGDVYTTAIGNDGNTGTSASAPKLTLTNLIATYSGTLTSGDTIFVDAGTYNNDVAITISSGMAGISIVGAGYQATIFDNQLAGAATNYLLYIIASNITVSDLSITGYENNGTQTPGHSGQAITIGGGAAITNVILQNVSFYNNGSSGGNPAISVLSNAEVTLIGGGSYCNSPGTAYTGGVELYGDNNILNIQDYILSNNEKTLFDGGGLRIEGGNNSFVNVTNTRISNNRGNEGGAISQRNGTLTMTDCIIDGNSTVNSGTHYGAAYRMHAGNATFSRCVFSNNTGGGTSCRGGAIGARYTSTGAFSANKIINIQVDSCIFENNQPGTKGRDIYGADQSGFDCNITTVDCQFLTGGNYNVYNDGSSPANSISVTYFGTSPTKSGTVGTTLSLNTLYTTAPAPPNFSGACGSIVLLPVELISFDGYCRSHDNILQWSTASESNNDFFIIDKLNSNGEFEEIARIKGTGTTNFLSNYEWIDENRSGAINYYRLSQLDIDGRKHEYEAIAIQQTCTTETVYFDQTRNAITLFHDTPTRELMVVNILNSAGIQIHSQDIDLKSNTKQSIIQLNTKLASGVYLINYHGSVSGSHISKLVVQ